MILFIERRKSSIVLGSNLVERFLWIGKQVRARNSFSSQILANIIFLDADNTSPFPQYLLSFIERVWNSWVACNSSAVFEL